MWAGPPLFVLLLNSATFLWKPGTVESELLVFVSTKV